MSYQPENPGDSIKSEWIVRELSRVGSELYWEAVSGGINYADGNVGINTTLPEAKLHIVSPNWQDQLQLTRAGNPSIVFEDTNNTVKTTIFQSYVGSKTRLNIDPNGGNDRTLFCMRDDGNLGLGTETPTEVLHVLGNIKLTGEVKAATLNLSSLPTSATGLATGDVWNNGGVLNIV